jgi:hypothetical protein
MEAALKAANTSKVEAERKLAEFVSGASELQEYFSAASANQQDSDASIIAWKRSAPLGAARGIAKKEKITMAVYGGLAVLLAATLIFLLWMMVKSL